MQEVFRQTALVSASKIDPDRHAKVLAISDRMELPPDMVERNFDSLSQKVKFDQGQMDLIKREHPGLSGWLSDRDNAAIAQDDLHVLRTLDYAVRSATAPQDDPNGYLPSGFRFDSNGTIVEPTEGGAQNSYRTIQDLQAEIEKRSIVAEGEQQIRQATAKKLREDFGPFANVFSGFVQSTASTAKFLRLVNAKEADEIIGLAGEASTELSPGFVGDIQRGLGGLVADVPLMLAGIPFARAAGSLLKLTRASEFVKSGAQVAAAVQPLAIREGVLTGQKHGTGAGLMAWAIEAVIPGAFGRTGVEKALIGSARPRSSDSPPVGCRRARRCCWRCVQPTERAG